MQHATTLARGMDDPHNRGRALANLVAAVAIYDLDEAVTLALGLSDPTYRDGALLSAIQEMGAADPDRAESLAHRISHPLLRACALKKPADRMPTQSFGDWTDTLLARLRAELGPGFTVDAT